jgi:hypothetical protein
MSMKERQAALNHRFKATRNEEADAGFRLRCECADLRCNATVELTEEERSHRRTHAAWFWVKPGHELASTDHVVEECASFTIVQLGATPFHRVSDRGEEDR